MTEEAIIEAVEKTISDCSGFSAPDCTRTICGVLAEELLKRVVRLHVREGAIVGTPYGPEIPNGKYVWLEPLNSELPASHEASKERG